MKTYLTKCTFLIISNNKKISHIFAVSRKLSSENIIHSFVKFTI